VQKKPKGKSEKLRYENDGENSGAEQNEDEKYDRQVHGPQIKRNIIEQEASENKLPKLRKTMASSSKSNRIDGSN
jgi:hypothetical protein